MKTVLTRGNASSMTVLMADSRATPEPIPSTDIIRKNRTENSCETKGDIYSVPFFVAIYCILVIKTGKQNEICLTLTVLIINY